MFSSLMTEGDNNMINRMEIPNGDNTVICQKWEEVELGWGSRPDGFSLHVSLESLRKHIEHIRNVYADNHEEWSQPCGTPYEVGVDDETYYEIVEHGGSKAYYNGYRYPGNGGTDGWVPVDL